MNRGYFLSMQHSPLIAKTQQTFWTSPEAPYLEVRTSLESTVAYAAHFHPTFSLGIILEARTCLSLGGERRVVSKGDLVLIEPGLVHSCNPVAGEPRSYHMLYMDTAWLYGIMGWQSAAQGEVAVQRRVLSNPALYQRLCSALAELYKGVAQAEAHFAEIVRQVVGAACVWEKQTTGGAREEITKARNLMAHCADKPMQVGVVSRSIGLGREGFTRRFHKFAGLPPGKYQHCVRLEEGRRLLRAGASIAEAALATGYADQSHFHRMFVKYFAATPRQYSRIKSQTFKK